MLIITADDFGLHQSVNEAVERAHRDGILTTASLMVAAPAALDAVARARLLPHLRVGLHLVLADGQPVLDASRIPDLIDASGRFGSNMVADGFRFFFLPKVRRQLAAEIRAQFEKFSDTGLALDHVNTHKHFHLHPTVLSLILSIGREFGMRAMRFPNPPHAAFWLRPWMALLRARLDRAAIAHNDYMLGIDETGQFDETALIRALADLPRGTGEIYFHPATVSGGTIAASMHGYRHADELAALLSPAVRRAIERLALPTGGFADLERAAA